MGLFGNNKKKIVVSGTTMMVRCPKCGRVARVTLVGFGDSYTCSCGRRLTSADRV